MGANKVIIICLLCVSFTLIKGEDSVETNDTITTTDVVLLLGEVLEDKKNNTAEQSKESEVSTTKLYRVYKFTPEDAVVPKDSRVSRNTVVHLEENNNSNQYYHALENHDFSGTGYDQLETSTALTLNSPKQIETIKTTSYHKKIEPFDPTPFQKIQHQEKGTAEIHYHQHQHLHKHKHLQEHVHDHKQAHMHEHGHYHDHDSVHDHNESSHHQHSHKDENHHSHKSEHRHDHNDQHHHQHKIFNGNDQPHYNQRSERRRKKNKTMRDNRRKNDYFYTKFTI